MPTIQSIVRQINRELVPQFEEKLRNYLVQQDKEWLIEQIIRLTLDAHSLEEADRKLVQLEKSKKREERINRLRQMALNRDKLHNFLDCYKSFNREILLREGFLLETAPEKGTDLIEAHARSQKGSDLLNHAKDVLFGLLFGDESTHTQFERTGQEVMTLTLPRHKAETLDFMKAATELSSIGTWQDPDSVSNDARADNVILEVEYGEIHGELIGSGVVLTLSLINNLEVNEQILYARMINVEQSTLIE